MGFFNTGPEAPFDKFISEIHAPTKLRPEMKYFNKMLLTDYVPDINGYTLTFMVPPEFAFLPNEQKEQWVSLNQMSTFKMIPFAAIDFTPPTIQVDSGAVQSRTGGVPYATELSPSGQCSITYIDNHRLEIYGFHLNWLMYIHELLEGKLEIPLDHDYLKINSPSFGTLDYAASVFVARYDPSMQNIMYVGKCTGVYPQGLPTKEVIGQRSANELTTLPFTYSCAWYDQTLDPEHYIYKELVDNLLSNFS